MARNVYALYFLDQQSGVKRFFYVGRSNDVPRRISEHIRLTSAGHEDKYQRLRELDQAGIPWSVEILREIPDGEYPPDNERWFVIKLTREGHELANMRHGSVERRRELARLVHSPEIRSIADVAHDRRRVEALVGVRRVSASRRLRHKIFKSTLKKVGFADLQADQLMPPLLRSRLLREGVDSIEAGVELKFLVRIARPDKARKEFKAWCAQIEAAHPLPLRGRHAATP